MPKSHKRPHCCLHSCIMNALQRAAKAALQCCCRSLHSRAITSVASSDGEEAALSVLRVSTKILRNVFAVAGPSVPGICPSPAMSCAVPCTLEVLNTYNNICLHLQVRLVEEHSVEGCSGEYHRPGHSMCHHLAKRQLCYRCHRSMRLYLREVSQFSCQRLICQEALKQSQCMQPACAESARRR